MLLKSDAQGEIRQPGIDAEAGDPPDQLRFRPAEQRRPCGVDLADGRIERRGRNEQVRHAPQPAALGGARGDPRLERLVQLAQRRFGACPLHRVPGLVGDLAHERDVRLCPVADGGVVDIHPGVPVPVADDRHVDDRARADLGGREGAGKQGEAAVRPAYDEGQRVVVQHVEEAHSVSAEVAPDGFRGGQHHRVRVAGLALLPRQAEQQRLPCLACAQHDFGQSCLGDIAAFDEDAGDRAGRVPDGLVDEIHEAPIQGAIRTGGERDRRTPGGGGLSGRINPVQPLEEALSCQLRQRFSHGFAQHVPADERDIGGVGQLEHVVGSAQQGHEARRLLEAPAQPLGLARRRPRGSRGQRPATPRYPCRGARRIIDRSAGGRRPYMRIYSIRLC